MAKASSLKEQAASLGKSKYAPVLSELDSNLASNLSLYTNAATQRTQGLDREIGSISAAGATTRKGIASLGAASQSAYQTAMSKQQQGTKDLLDKISANNTNMLSTLQADMRARGDTGWEKLSPLTEDANHRNTLLTAISQLESGRLQAAKSASQETSDRMQIMASMMQNTDAAKARGVAQSDLSDLYNKFLEARLGIEATKTKTKLEQQDYINQTYLTLKDRYEQKKAAEAQAKAASAAAAGNLAYKYESLKTNTQYKYDKLASDVSQKDIENSLKERGFSHKQAVDFAKLAQKDQELKASLMKANTATDIAKIVAGLPGMR